MPGDAAAPKPVVALKAVARTLDLMAADTVALQEVGSQRALMTLNGLLRVPYAYAHCVPGNSARGIHLAYLSRAPLTLQSHRRLPLLDAAGAPLCDFARDPAEALLPATALRLQRDLLQADLENHSAVDTVRGDAARVSSATAACAQSGLTLFNVHLKSKTEQPWRQLSSETIRKAEACAIVEYLRAFERRHPQRAVVLLGDFNDDWSSTALAPLAQLQWHDAVPFDRRNAGIPGRAPGTFWSRRRARIDFVWLNSVAAARLRGGSAKTHASTLAQRGSDHYPVSVELQL